MVINSTAARDSNIIAVNAAPTCTDACEHGQRIRRFAAMLMVWKEYAAQEPNNEGFVNAFFAIYCSCIKKWHYPV